MSRKNNRIRKKNLCLFTRNAAYKKYKNSIKPCLNKCDIVNNIGIYKTWEGEEMKLGMALSGGGIRGIAHAGVLKALEDNNIKVDIIGGTSAGSLVATLYAMGYSPYYIYILFKRYAKELVEINTSPILSGISGFMLNKKVKVKGLKTGKSIESIYNQIAYKKGIRRIEEIEMPLVIPTVDIMNGKEYVFTNRIPKGEEKNEQYIRDVTIGKAVRASSSFPAVFMPCEFGEHAFMDGRSIR